MRDLQFLVFTFVIISSFSFNVQVINASQSKIPSFLANKGDKEQYIINKYSISGSSLQVVQEIGLDNQVIQVELKVGVIVTVEFSGVKQYENGTAIPYGIVKYNNYTLFNAKLTSYIIESVNDQNYWNDFASKYNNVNLQGDTVTIKNNDTLGNEEIQSTITLWWSTGWVAYFYAKIISNSKTVGELELINTKYSKSSPFALEFSVLSLFLLVLTRIGSKKHIRRKGRNFL